MYKKAAASLVLVNLLFLVSYFCVMGIGKNRTWPVFTDSARELKFAELFPLDKESDEAVLDEVVLGDINLGIAAVAASGQRIVDCEVLQKEWKYKLDEGDMEALCRIVESEAGTEDADGKLLVANVVLNRMEDGHFPDTVTEVVMQKEKGVSQFSPVANGRYYKVEISQETVNAVERALMGEDISQGALYFVAREYADSERVKWFDNNLKYLFRHGGHEFYAPAS